LQIWTDERDIRLAALAGLCAGFAYAVKYPVGFIVPYGLAVICLGSRRDKREMVRSCTVFALLAAVSIAPWMIRDWFYFGNPVAPFFNRIFPNPFVTVEFEDIYHSVLAHANDLKLSEIPWESTVGGWRACGFLGCVFLLAPIALLSLRQKRGRQLMLAAALFALPIVGNKGTRFLIPAIPFLSLAMGMALARWPRLAATVVLAHAITSWPTVAAKYAHPWAWRIWEAPWKEALRLVPEGPFIAAHDAEYASTQVLNQLTPPDSRTFTFNEYAASYCTRDVMSDFGTAEGIRLKDTLWLASQPQYQPLQRWTFHFNAPPLYGIRIVQTASGTDIWRIAELTFMDGGAEVRVAPNWQLTAKPFPWNADLAVDRRAITYWRSDRAITPGMYYQVRFGGGQQKIDSVLLDGPRDQAQVRMRLEGEVQPGQWQALAEPSVAVSPFPVEDQRRAAVAEVRRAGMGYILIRPHSWITDDVAKDSAAWGLVQIGDAGGGWRLYRIE